MHPSFLGKKKWKTFFFQFWFSSKKTTIQNYILIKYGFRKINPFFAFMFSCFLLSCFLVMLIVFVSFVKLEIFIPSCDIVWWWSLWIGWIIIEISCIGYTLNRGFNGRLQSAILQSPPIETIEPSGKINK